MNDQDTPLAAPGDQGPPPPLSGVETVPLPTDDWNGASNCSDEEESGFDFPLAGAARNALRTLEVPIDPANPSVLLERFALWKRYNRSGQGEVYGAWDYKLERFVVLKFLSTRLLEEARAASQLAGEHHVIHVEDYNTTRPERPFIVMEFAAGGTFGEPWLMEMWATKPRLLVEKILPIVRVVNLAHERGLVHRDIKPDNILLVGSLPSSAVDPQPGGALVPPPASETFALEQLTAKIADFGLATRHGSENGERCGTRRFAAPEQWDGNALPPVDQFGLGATLYYLLTKKNAVESDKVPLAGERRADEWYTPPVSPGRINQAVDDDLSAIVMKTLALQPQERYPTTADLAEDLQRYLDGRPVEANGFRGRFRKGWRRNRRIVVPLGVLLLLAFVGILFGAWRWRGQLHAEARDERNRERAALRSLVEAGSWREALQRFETFLDSTAAEDADEATPLRVERLPGLLAANRIVEFNRELDALAVRTDLGPLVAPIRAYQAERLSWRDDAEAAETAREAVALFDAQAPAVKPTGWDAARAHAQALTIAAPEPRLQALRDAAGAHPFFFPLRRNLLLALVGAGRFDQAKEETHFCRAHFPDSPVSELAELTMDALKHKGRTFQIGNLRIADGMDDAGQAAAVNLLNELVDQLY